jgi:hypothetical protein
MHGNMNVKFTATCFGLYKRNRHQADNVPKKICHANKIILRKISVYAVECSTSQASWQTHKAETI